MEKTHRCSRSVRPQFHAVLTELGIDVAEAMQALRFHGRMAQRLTSPGDYLTQLCESLAAGDAVTGEEA